MDEQLETDETFDPSSRKLCPDGACVGVIGDDGLCRVCGRTEAQATAGEEAPGGMSSDFDASSGDAPAGEAAVGGFDPNRRLCDDGMCVGVVGADGVCAVCGRRAE
ncbi:MAG TPA: hypothetical protein VH560_03925 [Polyangia bacterium]|jgi:hypothetical protein|nr:hypothetical protein [Polyangia bacterium]